MIAEPNDFLRRPVAAASVAGANNNLTLRMTNIDSKSVTKDPICGMTVNEKTALHTERDGKTFYFCSDAGAEGKAGFCEG